MSDDLNFSFDDDSSFEPRQEEDVHSHDRDRAASESRSSWTLSRLQQLIDVMYSDKDRERGIEGTFMWFMEEVGELSAELREAGSFDENERRNRNPGSSHSRLESEFADVLAWLVTMANVMNISLTEAMQNKYGSGCPGCGMMICRCDAEEKP